MYHYLISSLSIVQNYVYSLGNAPLVFLLTFVVPLLMYLAAPRDEKLVGLQPPKATPSLPLLGNALYYKKNPDQFLVRQAETLGGIFTINLAGLETTIITSKKAIEQFAFASERVLSSRAAVSDFGFRYTLGDRNVFSGTDVHKRVIKQKYSSTVDMENVSHLYWSHLKDAIEDEMGLGECNEKIIDDFLIFTRRVMLRAFTYEMIGSHVVELYNSMYDSDFISLFMDFQDFVEECTANAAVCPSWLSPFLFLKKCQSMRMNIVSKLAAAIKRALDSNNKKDIGRWVIAVHNMKKADDSKLYNCDDIADFAMGLLFAAHKNASIAAAQSILLSLEFNSADLMQQMHAEAEALSRDIEKENFPLLDLLERCDVIERVVLETLRVVAHSIGSIRKVIVKEGWTLIVEDDKNPNFPPKKYTLPVGSYVGVSHIVPHRNPLLWGADCSSFNPFRDDLVLRCQDDLVFTNFSHGVHKCPGNKIALIVVRLFLAIILSKYKMSIPKNRTLSAVSFERATLAQRQDACSIQCTKITAD